MSATVKCPACQQPLLITPEIYGQTIQCPRCARQMLIPRPKSAASLPPPAATQFKAQPGAPRPSHSPAQSKPARQPVQRFSEDDDFDEDDRPRRKKAKAKSSSLGLYLGLGGGIGVLLILLIVVVILIVNRGGGQQVQVAQNPPPGVQPAIANPVVQNPAAVAPVAGRPPATLPAGQAMNGEQVYQRLLRSTVLIQGRPKTAPNIAANPGAPRPPFGPKPPFGPAGNNQFANTVWEGTETLQGFGKLRFEFSNGNQVTMIDAQSTARGTWSSLGLTGVTIRFGEVVYTGNLVGNSLIGTARQPGQNGRPPQSWGWNTSKVQGAVPNPNTPMDMAGMSQGSGALIDRQERLVITNVHVAGDLDRILVYFPQFDAQGNVLSQRNVYKAPIEGRLVFKEDRADLALVQLSALPNNVLTLPLAPAQARQAQEVHSVGNPGASKALWSYSPGKVRQVFPDEWKIRDSMTGRPVSYKAMKLETTSPINPGDSGGPLVNDKAQLVGVAHATDLDAANFSYFIDASEVKTLVERYYQSIGKTWRPTVE